MSFLKQGFASFAVSALLLGGCHPAHVHSPEGCLAPPKSYSKASSEIPITQPWWKAFQVEELSEIIESCLEENLSLKVALERIQQADHLYAIEFSRKFPRLSLNAQGSRNYTNATGSNHFSSYLLAPNLSYEVDLFGSISHDAASAYEDRLATLEEGHQAALLLSGRAAKLWFTIVEQNALLEVLDQQVKINETLLELVELRFQIGEANALDLIQQKQQLAATRSAIPPVEALKKTSLHQLAVLMGKPPIQEHPLAEEIELPLLPSLPCLSTPEALVACRPDLRASLHRIASANQQVSRALADLWPKISFDLSYQFSSAHFSNLFDGYLATLLGNLTAPLFDGNRRREDVKLQKSFLKGAIATFNEAFLTAILEIENSLINEEKQVELIDRLEYQLDLAERNLEKARQRYLNGVSDYLPVIAAIQSLHQLERRIVSERSRLVQFRTDLYLSLGGSWTNTLLERAENGF